MTILEDITAAMLKVEQIHATRPVMLVHPDDYEAARAYIVGDIARLIEIEQSLHVEQGKAIVMRRDVLTIKDTPNPYRATETEETA